MTAASKKVPLSQRALIQRINRQLIKQDEQLKTSRSERIANDVGWYYVLNVSRNFIAQQHVDPVAFGRDLGVIQPWEEVVNS